MEGRQVKVPRALRVCKLCGVELEDAEHVMLWCDEYSEERCELKAPRPHRSGRSGLWKAMERRKACSY